MRERVNRLDAQTHRRTGVTSVREQVFPLPHVCFPRCVCASSSACSYSRSTTATSSQQFCRGHRAQSAHTLSGKCSRSAGAKPTFRKNPGLRVSASTSARPCTRASRSEEHTSELQSLAYLVCRLLLEKK